MLGGSNRHICTGISDFFLGFLSCLFCRRALDVLGYQEASLVAVVVCFLSMICPIFRSLVFPVDPLDAIELESCPAAILLACTDVGALRLLASRTPITKISPDSANPHKHLSFLPTDNRYSCTTVLPRALVVAARFLFPVCTQ